MEVAIIGGGIGGLTTALALQKANISCAIYEGASAIRPVGAGIIIANNAMQVFKHLSIDHEIYNQGYMLDGMFITTSKFSNLSSISLEKFSNKYGLQNHAIHRYSLHQILEKAVGSQYIKLGKRLQDISKVDGKYSLQFEDGSSARYSYIIGADGIKSKVRQQLFSENEYRDAHQICWRGVSDHTLPEAFSRKAVEAWGKGIRIGFVQISDQKIYWYLVINSSLENKDRQLDSYVKDFHPFAASLIRNTPMETIIKNPLYDLKPIWEWQKDNVCLLGDAAHATTPNLGQGACQAIEDAYILGELAKKYSLSDAFKKYPEIRRAKAHDVVNVSWKFGSLSHLTNPFGIAIRNIVLKYLTPDSVNLKKMEKIFALNIVE